MSWTRGPMAARYALYLAVLVLALAALAEALIRTESGVLRTGLDGPAPPGLPQPTDGGDRGPAVLLALLSTLPLALVPTHTGSAAVLIGAAVLGSLTSERSPTLAGAIAQVAVLAVLARQGVRWPAFLAVIVFGVHAFAADLGHGTWDRFVTVLLTMACAAVAATGSAGRAPPGAAAYSPEAQALADTLHEHAARGERARIARELHDVVAHHISMISVQSENARLTTTGLPPEGARRFQAIGDTARAALTEMRRLLGVLREDTGTETGRKPQPALQQLVDLVDDARDSGGAATRLIVQGAVVPLDPGIELTAYRIVQEALTNVRRHAPGAAVDVELRYSRAELRVRVRDNGPGPRTRDTAGRPASPGHGLVGMRERAAMVGGDLSTGPAAGGGFVVEARLPIPEPGEGGAG